MLYWKRYLLALFFSCFIHSSYCWSFYEVAICAIFQDEASYLKEWIEFHKIQKVEHFYLYNNRSQDNYLEVLQPYMDANEVTLVDWSFEYDYGDHVQWIKIQSGAYMNCIHSYGGCVKWLAAIDIDEFLFCPDGTPLPQVLSHYMDYGGLAVNWLKFGTSGVQRIPEGHCLIEMLLYRSEIGHHDNRFIKSIVQPSRVAGCYNAHFFAYKEPYFAVDSYGRRVDRDSNANKVVDLIRIHHYWVRTEEFLFNYKMPSRQKRRPIFTDAVMLQLAAESNVCLDLAILPYVEQLRKAMGF